MIDLFQARLPGPIAFEELATQAQVAMSVLWIVLGAIVFVFGLARGTSSSARPASPCWRSPRLKVFVFDLASLDVAYRVLSLIALGTFLLLTAWVYARLTPASARGGARRLKSRGWNGHRSVGGRGPFPVSSAVDAQDRPDPDSDHRPARPHRRFRPRPDRARLARTPAVVRSRRSSGSTSRAASGSNTRRSRSATRSRASRISRSSGRSSRTG